MKKALVLAMSMTLVATMFGCGSNEGSGTSSPAATQSATAGTQKPAEPAKIKFYTYKADKPEEPFVAAVKAFNESHKDIQVEYVALVQNNDAVEFATKLDILTAAGETVDVIHTANMDQLMARAARGVMEPIDDFYKKNNIKAEDEYVLNPILNNKTYGMIVNATQMLTVFNKNHLQEAGMKLPEMGWTWDDFRDYAKKLTTKDHYGTYFHSWGEYANPIAFNEMAHPQLKNDLSLAFDDPSYKYFFELRRAMEKEDKSVEPYADVLAGKYHVLQQFFAGKASMLAVPAYVVRAGTQLDRFPHDFQMVYAPAPRSSKNAEVGLTNVTGSFLAMGSKSKNKEASYTFMRWMSTEGAAYMKDIPGWKKADGKKLLNDFFGSQSKLIDLESLSNTLFHPKNKMLTGGPSVSYGSELKTMVENNFNKYILDNLSFEEVQKKMMNEGQAIVKKNQK
jgi:multiple sugar transport system substrate-binding protein